MLTIAPPNSNIQERFLTDFPGMTRYIESFKDAGTYLWFVSALVSDNGILCTSDVFSFTKPKTVIPTAKP
jgi:hypothetical protein